MANAESERMAKESTLIQIIGLKSDGKMGNIFIRYGIEWFGLWLEKNWEGDDYTPHFFHEWDVKHHICGEGWTAEYIYGEDSFKRVQKFKKRVEEKDGKKEAINILPYPLKLPTLWSF